MTGDAIFRATLFHTPARTFLEAEGAFAAIEDGALVVRSGRIAACGGFASIRGRFPDARVEDRRGGLIVPGFVDAHTHFPQLRIVGSVGRQLLQWLDEVALPEEAAMADTAYAAGIARRFVQELAAHGTTAAMVFGAHFPEATAALFDAAAEAGLRVVSGLVCSDRLLRADLLQQPAAVYDATMALIRRYHNRGRLLYAVTPRFALSASEAMLEVCQTIVRECPDVRVQTHLNENAGEIASVAKLFPWAGDYLRVYERYGLAGERAVLAHDVHPTPSELERLAASRASIAHCPSSNSSLASGVFPMAKHIEAGVRVALGTDIGAGMNFGIPAEAGQAYLVQNVAAGGQKLRPEHLLFLATAAGARALGLAEETGDFTPGKAADFVYIRPGTGGRLAGAFERAGSLRDKLGLVFSVGTSRDVREVRVAGEVVFCR
jgi:guanine deaminase